MNISFPFRCLAAWLMVFAAQTLPSSAVTFTNDTRISFNNTNYEGVEIVVTNCTLTVDGAHTFASVQIFNGGNITHTFAENGQPQDGFTVTNEQHVLSFTNAEALINFNADMTTIVVSDVPGLIIYTNGVDYVAGFSTNGFVTIQRTDNSFIPDGGTVQVGYEVGAEVVNPPVPTGLNLVVAGDVLVDQGGNINVDGKGYGGARGPGQGATTGYYLPSGSGAGHGGYGGLGVSNTLGGLVYDLIPQPTGLGSGGGTGLQGPGGSGGGAIHLIVGGALHVNGGISARGANGISERSGGGSGGSVWLTAQSIDGTGSISADGGPGEPTLGGGGGGGRIAIYFASTAFSGSALARGGKGFIAGGAGTVYTKSASRPVGDVLVDNGGRSGTNTLVTATEQFGLTVQGGAVVALPQFQTLGNLLVVSNGLVVMSGQSLTVINNVTVQVGGAITADGIGSPGNQGTGAGKYSTSSPYSGGGGGYGGSGTDSALGQAGGVAYGATTITQPESNGSGGGGFYGLPPGGAGGGAVRLIVTGNLAVNGRISANGGAGIGLGSGGGAGGSIWLTVGTLSGSGTISANGGIGNGVGGGGGGGRIAIYYDTNAFTGVANAWGAVSGANVGGAGTVYTKANGQSVGLVVLDNGGRNGTNTTGTFSTTSPIDLTVGGGAIIPQPSSQIRNLIIGSNGWMMMSQGTVLTVLGNATIQTGSGIIADATGSPGGQGSGAGRSSFVSVTTGSGGGYGGYGAVAGTAAGGIPYGSASEPVNMGSGGGLGLSTSYPRIPAGSGGGLITMNVTGTLALDGRISAEGGAPPLGTLGGGGSGGGVWLRVGTLSGSGTISANGGMGDGIGGGGGGGGRIAVSYFASTFAGIMRAWGGSSSSSTNVGGAGTIYTRANSVTGQSAGLVVVDNGGRNGNNTVLGSVSTPVDVTVGGGAAITYPWPSIRNLLIASNGWVVSSNFTPMSVTGNATIQSGGGIVADGLGSSAGQGQGFGRTSSQPTTGSGGGYGGYGAVAGTAAGGIPYGSASQPVSLGSGGGLGLNISSPAAGSGGGIINLNVTGTLVVDGRISADGGVPSFGTSGGGGSGGSVWLTAGRLSGGGTVSANGGMGDGFGGGGGGGRIALYSSTNAFAGIIRAWGGSSSSTNVGGAGTNLHPDKQPIGGADRVG